MKAIDDFTGRNNYLLKVPVFKPSALFSLRSFFTAYKRRVKFSQSNEKFVKNQTDHHDLKPSLM
jgi:hypothetical protein